MIFITDEPKGKTYEGLFRFAAERCHSFSLVWRRKMGPKPANDETLAALEPFFISEQETGKWPGTKLKGTATVRHYQFTRKVMPVLLRTNGLYSWIHPKYPEDLALYLPNGDHWLASVAHEHLSWITGPDLTVEKLRKEIPGLQVKE